MYGYQGYGQAPSAGDAQSYASILYPLIQQGLTQQVGTQLLQIADPALRNQTCALMAQQAQTDTDTTMPQKVAQACAASGSSAGSTGLSTTTWLILGGVALAGVYFLVKKH